MKINKTIYLIIALIIILGIFYFLRDDNNMSEPVSDTPTEEPARQAFPSSVTKAVINDITTTSDYNSSQINITSVTEQIWPNGCLGLAQEDEFCTEVLVNGYEVQAEADGVLFIYRTDSNGNQVRLESKVNN